LEKQSKRILIVEDELIIALMIEKMVTSMGHKVIGKVTSGEEAIKKVSDDIPDLILMDIRLDGVLDGIETMQEIRKQADIPVIYITGNTDNLYKKRVEESDYLAFLTKPVTQYELNRTFSVAS